jgi:hypothetical protein
MLLVLPLLSLLPMMSMQLWVPLWPPSGGRQRHRGRFKWSVPQPDRSKGLARGMQA